MRSPRFAQLLLSAIVLIGASTIVVARMGPGDTRAIPYAGVLEQNGVAATGTFDMRFGLLPTANSDASCVAANNCALWSEEQSVDVVDGRFSVILGDGAGADLDDAVLGSPRLFLGVAVKAPQDADFTLLGGLQEVVPVPLTARAARADIAGVAASVAPGSIDNTALAAGSVTRDKLAPGTRFSAQVAWNGVSYTATQVNPPNWFQSNTASLASGYIDFTPVIGGVTMYTCVTAAVIPGQEQGVVETGPNRLRFEPATVNCPFTLICDAW